MTVTDTQTAIQSGLSNGDHVYMAGFGHLVPYALGHEIIRQNLSDLTITKPIVDTLLDQMVAAGCVSKVLFSWTGGTCLERAWRAGEVEIEEYTHYGTIARIHAGARNIPHIPVRTFTGSDLLSHNDKISMIEDPYTGERIPILPPLNPDVTILHAHRADQAGNIQIQGLNTDVRDAAYAADTVIATVEELVSRETIQSNPNLTVVPGSEIDYLSEEPFGAHPSYVQDYYDSDRGVFEWREIAESEADVADWLDEWVYSLPDREAYIKKVGAERLLAIRPAARRSRNLQTPTTAQTNGSGQLEAGTQSIHVDLDAEDSIPYADAELMVVTAAREIRDGESVMVGLGLPSVASNLAKRTHAPTIEQVYEAGIVGAAPQGAIPYGVSNPELVDGTAAAVPMIDVFGTLLQSGKLDVGFLGGAQVDEFGNINSTVIGEYDDPDVRLPGSGGACTIACNAGRTLIIMPHELRRFPEQVDFLTSPGYLDDSTTRSELGLQGGGPELIITDKAVFRFDDTGRAYVDSLHPGVSRADVQEVTGWELTFAENVSRTPTPTAEELRLIREDIDPDNVYIETEP